MRSALIVLIVTLPGAARAADPPEADYFEKHIRPILVEKCLSCHAGEKPKGGLKLDSRRSLLGGGRGGAVVVSGKPKESRLIAALRHLDQDLKMPPPGKLPDREIALFNGSICPGRKSLAAPDATGGHESPPIFGRRCRRQASRTQRSLQAADHDNDCNRAPADAPRDAPMASAEGEVEPGEPRAYEG